MYQVIGADGAPGAAVDLPALKEMAATGRIGPATIVLDSISKKTLPASEMFVHENLFGACDSVSVEPPRTFYQSPFSTVEPVRRAPVSRFPETIQAPAAPPTTQYNVPQSAYPPQQYPTAIVPEQKSKIAAGLFAILFPYLGIHGFYTGNTALGLTVLISSISCFVLTIITFGILIVLTLPALIVIHILSLIQGILYLSASDEDFQQKYVIEKRWF
jgi:hypothetical protein